MAIIALHFIAGIVAGSIFAARTLLLLVGIVLIECLAAASLIGFGAALYPAGGVVTLQIGYLLGIGLRATLERSVAQRSAWPHHKR
jgi:hypothetical protein